MYKHITDIQTDIFDYRVPLLLIRIFRPVTGWGTTKYRGQISEILQKATVSIADQTDCKNAFSRINQTVRFMF